MVKIVKESHMDHNLTINIQEVLEKYFSKKEGFFIETIDLKEKAGMCALYGPAMGDAPVAGPADDEVFYHVRGERAYKSRLVNWAPRESNLITVIAGPYGEEPCVLYTAFAGPLAPKEPGDPSLKEEEREASEAFWAEHALSAR